MLTINTQFSFYSEWFTSMSSLLLLCRRFIPFPLGRQCVLLWVKRPRGVETKSVVWQPMRLDSFRLMNQLKLWVWYALDFLSLSTKFVLFCEAKSNRWKTSNNKYILERYFVQSLTARDLHWLVIEIKKWQRSGIPLRGTMVEIKLQKIYPFIPDQNISWISIEKVVKKRIMNTTPQY